MFKSQNKLANTFCFKDSILKELTSGVAYKFQCGECVRHLDVWIGEHIRISSSTGKKVKRKGSDVSNHLLLCKHWLSFESFSVLTKRIIKFVLGLKESLQIMRYQPSLKRNIRSAPICLFDRV